jgi:hypothetical protein
METLFVQSRKMRNDLGFVFGISSGMHENICRSVRGLLKKNQLESSMGFTGDFSMDAGGKKAH